MASSPYILSIGKGIPRYAISQEEAALQCISLLNCSAAHAHILKKIFRNSCIQKRYSILPDIIQKASIESFGMSERNAFYKREAPLLAVMAARNAVESWQGATDEITHVISISCTGMMAPGIEFLLLKELGLQNSVKRLGINFMGCFGAFQGLKTAAQISLQDHRHRVLVVCTELCSLHLHPITSIESIVINSLFGDGSAAVMVGCHPKAHETPFLEIVEDSCLALDDSLGEMSWEAADHGLKMGLSVHVPQFFGKYMQSFVESLVPNKMDFSDYEWAIHPGGKAIMQAIERSLHLSQDQTDASWKVLAEHGNMSSATFLFILDAIRQKKQAKERIIGLAFGPGLGMEGMVFHKC